MTHTHPNPPNSTPQTLPHKHPEEVSKLARMIAIKLNDWANLNEYELLCLNTDHSILKRSIEETSRVPKDKIKKSKKALFYFLVNKHAKEAN